MVARMETKRGTLLHYQHACASARKHMSILRLAFDNVRTQTIGSMTLRNYIFCVGEVSDIDHVFQQEL